jgi:hypothetical protein
LRLDLHERRFPSELGFRVVAISCIFSGTWAVRVGMASRQNHCVNCRISLLGMGRAEGVAACTCTTALHINPSVTGQFWSPAPIADH